MRAKRFIGLALSVSLLAPTALSAQARHQSDSWWGADKVKHFLMSAFIESVTFSGFQAAGANRNAAFSGAFAAAAAFGIGKEFSDRRTKGLFSYRDLVWDGLGTGAGFLVLKSTQR
jgi:putative lipoprotein